MLPAEAATNELIALIWILFRVRAIKLCSLKLALLLAAVNAPDKYRKQPTSINTELFKLAGIVAKDDAHKLQQHEKSFIKNPGNSKENQWLSFNFSTLPGQQL